MGRSRRLAPTRLLREAPPGWVEYQMQWYDEEEWLDLFGTPKPPEPPAEPE